MISGDAASMRIELLVDHPELIPAVGKLRWQDWGHEPEPTELSWWVDVTASESGRTDLPVTFVAIDAAGSAMGAVGLGEFEPDERRDRSPWVMGMIVQPELRGRGLGRLLLGTLCAWTADHGYDRLWVATGDYAVGFYQACGWTVAETFDRPGETVIVLTTTP
ncbi:MAG TPA: GNAT family N-acetyltransferase [Streptosporangiaceae bacterium]|nr:GNAT family N-acetyltransferase [Streptosporangiaceae bacterium]